MENSHASVEYNEWSAEEVKAWEDAAEWGREESEAVEVWAQQEVAAESLEEKLEREYEEVLARFQQLAGSVAVSGAVDKK